MAVALGKVAPRTREREEFSAGAARPSAPRRKQPQTSWSLESIRSARDAQVRGVFALPVRLAEAIRTDDALFVPYCTRIDPQSALSTRLEPVGGVRGEAIARAARGSIVLPRHVLKALHGTLVNHGVAVGRLVHEANETGTRVDVRLEEWPLEHVRYDYERGCLTTATDGGERVDVLHGDGHWVVLRKCGVLPWAQEACLLPAAFVWAAHAEAIGDWSATTRAHGLAKIVGQLPEGVSLSDGEELTAEAAAFLETLQSLASGEAAAGVAPAGSDVKWMSNGSSAWQVFDASVLSREKAAARIYLGTDASLGSVGGAPGVDISTLFGISSTRLQGDIVAIETGINTGIVQPWTAINYGSSRYAPRFAYLLPDPDETRNREETAANRERLLRDVERLRELGFLVTQELVAELAIQYGVSPVPVLAPSADRAVPLELAPTDLAKVVRAREARASQGLPAFGDQRDDLTITELAALGEAQGEAEGEA
ncbi:MAG: hypothetical protein WDA41_09820 [Candidatus Neomarinimicrobiota bacterium]